MAEAMQAAQLAIGDAGAGAVEPHGAPGQLAEAMQMSRPDSPVGT